MKKTDLYVLEEKHDHGDWEIVSGPLSHEEIQKQFIDLEDLYEISSEFIPVPKVRISPYRAESTKSK